MKTLKNSNEIIGENTTIGHANFKNGKLSYPNGKPKSQFDGLF